MRKGWHRQLVSYLLLIQLSTLSLISSDIYLPLLAATAEDLNASVNAMQFTIAIYFMALGVSQFFIGYILDRKGVKLVLLISAPIYLAGCLICYFAESTSVFCCGRLLQAFGASAPLAAWQPLTLEIFGEEKGKAVGTYLFMLLSLSPGMAPLLGTAIFVRCGWRFIFILLSVNAIVAAGLVIHVCKNWHGKADVSKIAGKDFTLLVANADFRRYLLAISLNYSCYLAFIITYPALATAEHGLVGASLEFLPIASSFLLGAYVSKHLMQRSQQQRAIALGTSLFVASAISFVVGAFWGEQSPVFSILIPFCVLMFGSGIFLPAATYEAIQMGGVMKNSVSGVLGGTRMCVAFLVSASLTLVPVHQQAAVTVIFICLATLLSVLIVRGHQRSRLCGE